MSALDLYLVVIVHVGMVPAIGFPLYYRRSAWRSTNVGKALMFKGTALACLFTVAVVGFWWPFPGYRYIYALVVTGVVAGVTYQFLVMRGLQKRGQVEQHGRF